MAVRPVFVPFPKAPYVAKIDISFNWNPGLSEAQKKRNVAALHESFNVRYPEKKLLEISTKSLQQSGIELSAFNLRKYVPSLGRSVPVECVYQGSKVFSSGDPFIDLYEKTPREAKKDERIQSSGRLIGFSFDGEDYDSEPVSAFYMWLYINALAEDPERAKKLLKYDGFTDIEFNPEKSVSCQAQAAAAYKSLSVLGLLQECRDFSDFKALISG